jgi:DNA polymerase III subunit delta
MIIFLYGEDTYRSRQKLKELKDKFLREVDASGNSLIVINGETAGLENINEVVATPSLFSTKRMIVIEKMLNNKNQKVQEELIDYLKKKFSKNDKHENILIFWDEIETEQFSKNKLFQFLSAEKYAQEFKTLSNTATATWIKKEIENRGAKIKPAAVTLLVSFLGNDLWQINNEINKLFNYKLGEEKNELKDLIIEAEDVEKLVHGKVDENIFAFTDAISNKNKALALKLLEDEIEVGVTEPHLISMIVRQFRILLQVRQALESGLTSRQMVSQLKLHPFVAQKALAQVQKFSLEKLKQIFLELIEIDKKFKSGEADVKTELGLLIARIND